MSLSTECSSTPPHAGFFIAAGNALGSCPQPMTLDTLMTLALLQELLMALRANDAVVICAGFGGISLGSTPTAMANMKAVTLQHGPSIRAFLIVPLVSAFFLDLVNAILIPAFVGRF